MSPKRKKYFISKNAEALMILKSIMSPKRKKYFNSKNAEAKLVQNIFEPIAHFHDIETSETAQKERSSFSCCLDFTHFPQACFG